MIWQTEYASEDEEEETRDPQRRVRLWLVFGALVCLIVLAVAYGVVLL